jgi:protein TonB
VALALSGCVATAPKDVGSVQLAPQAHPVQPVPEIEIAAPAVAPSTVPPAPTARAVTGPTVRKRVEPTYPAELSREGIPGEVVLTFFVGENGQPEDVRIERSTHPAFSKAVMAVVPRWRFDPARAADGSAVRSRMRMPVRFLVND